MAEQIRVRGDWMDPDQESYPVLELGDPWNGWAAPVFDEATARRVVADQATVAEYGDGDNDRLEIEERPGGMVVRHLQRDFDGADEWTEVAVYGPGTYPVGSWFWTWEVDDGEAGDAGDAEAPEWVQVGEVGVDAGMVWIGDPSYVMGDDAPHRVRDWGRFVATLKDEGFHESPFEAAEPLGRWMGLAVHSGLGDGVYPVEVRREFHPSFGDRIAEVRVRFLPHPALG